MRVAVVHPTMWPFVRRGTERFMQGLVQYLKRSGHDVVLVSSRPRGSTVVPDGRVELRAYPELWGPWLARLGVHPFHVFPLTALYALRGESFDVIHCFNFTDALALTTTHAVDGPVLLHVTVIPERVKYRRSLSLGGALLERAVKDCAGLLTVSRFQQAYFEERFGREAHRLAGPIDLERFPFAPGARPEPPCILFAAAASDRRKGARCLMTAFNLVKEECPEAILQIAASLDEGLEAELLSLVREELREDVHFLTRGSEEELPRLYAEASVTVLPSMWEVFPLVVLESLAAGTPVVGTDDGGIPELIADERMGRLFEPGSEGPEPANHEGLARAILEALELSGRLDTAVARRRFAEGFTWDVLGPEYVRLYQALS